MFVLERGVVGFPVGAAVLRIFDSYQYIRILRGVQYTCLFVQTIREYLRKLEIDPPPGELAFISEAMKNIISKPEFLEVPEKKSLEVSLF